MRIGRFRVIPDAAVLAEHKRVRGYILEVASDPTGRPTATKTREHAAAITAPCSCTPVDSRCPTWGRSARTCSRTRATSWCNASHSPRWPLTTGRCCAALTPLMRVAARFMLRPSGAWLQTPVASFEDKDGDFTIVNKFIGELCAAPLSDEGSLARAPQCRCLRDERAAHVARCRYEAKQGHSPFDVVAWHGNYAPYKYDLRKYAAVGT